MDSLTQLALGAAVGEAVLGRKVGRKAILWGAVCGTVPDLDIFLPFGDPVRDFTYHRSFSHSIFILTLLTPIIVWLIGKLHPKTVQHKSNWTLLVWLTFMTHILLDCFTVYGTQIFWPLWDYPVGWASMFIIDPLYTVPLLLGVLAALFMTREQNRGHLLNRSALVISTLYLAWSLGAQRYVISTVEQSLARQTLSYEKLLVSAGPLTTLLWRIVAMRPDGNYYEGYYSLLDGNRDIGMKAHVSRSDLLGKLKEHWPVRRLQWFTKGFYKVWLDNGELVLSDLRMGTEPSYVFSFVVAKKKDNPHLLPIVPRRLTPNRDLTLLRKVWKRVWSATE